MRRLRGRSRATAGVQNSSFELVELIDIGRPIMPVDGDNHRQSYSGFGGGDRDGKDCDHHAGRRMRWRSETPERNEIQIRRREHHLDPDENENGVTATQRGEKPDGKQRRRDNEEELKCWCHDAVYLASGERTP